MKTILSIILLVVTFLGLQAQERTVNMAGTDKVWKLDETNTLTYVGNTNDRLIPTTRDTIDYYVQVSGFSTNPQHIYAQFTFDTIDGADTTIAITVQQKKFASESYSDIIASALTSAISAETKVIKTTIGVTSPLTYTQASATDYMRQAVSGNSDTLTVAARSITYLDNTLLHYRFLKFRLIIQGNDQVGTGIVVKKIELISFN